MLELYHYPLDPFGRIVRVYLKEKKIEFQSVEETPWKRKKIFAEYHMFSDLPALVESNRIIWESAPVIVEHFEQFPRIVSLWGNNEKSKIESKRLAFLFNTYFFAEVTHRILFEKVIKKYLERSSPDSSIIRKGNNNIKKYFDYISWLIDRRNWLAGNEFSLADISAASHISCIDYLGSVEWDNYPIVKDWYVRIKSRPSFRDLLNDRVANIIPVSYYQELDF